MASTTSSVGVSSSSVPLRSRFQDVSTTPSRYNGGSYSNATSSSSSSTSMSSTLMPSSSSTLTSSTSSSAPLAVGDFHLLDLGDDDSTSRSSSDSSSMKDYKKTDGTSSSSGYAMKGASGTSTSPLLVKKRGNRLISLLTLLLRKPRGLRWWQEYLGVDRRSMALARVFIGLSIILDVVNRMSDLEAHYTDAGVMPRAMILDPEVAGIHHSWWTSLHMSGGSYYFQATLFTLHIVIGVLFIVGWHTRTMNVLLWLFGAGLNNRAMPVMHGGDVLQRCVLLWATLLPLGSCFSLDAARETLHRIRHGSGRTGQLSQEEASTWFLFSRFKGIAGIQGLQLPHRYSFVSVASLGITLQYAIMYTSSTVHKTGDEWLVSGGATWLALQLDYFRTIIGDITLATIPPYLLALMTWAVLWWEFWGAVCMYAPLLTGPFRLLGVVGYWLMHFGFGLMLRLGQFVTFSCSGLLMALPTWFWDVVIMRRLRTPARKNFRLYYPIDCDSCVNIASILQTFILIPDTKVIGLSVHEYASLCSDVKAPTHRAMEGFVAQDMSGQLYSGFAAKVATWRVSPLLWPLASIIGYSGGNGPVRRGLFTLSAKISHAVAHSHRPAELQATRKVEVQESLLEVVFSMTAHLIKAVVANSAGLALLVLMIGLCALEIGQTAYAPPAWLTRLNPVLGMDQNWRMFAPRPPSAEWGYSIKGVLRNSTEVELWRREGLFTWEATPFSDVPDDHRLFHNVWWKDIRNHRWWKYYENGYNVIAGWSPANSRVRLEFGRWICRNYNARHREQPLQSFSVELTMEGYDCNRPDDARVTYAPRSLWEHKCFG